MNNEELLKLIEESKLLSNLDSYNDEIIKSINWCTKENTKQGDLVVFDIDIAKTKNLYTKGHWDKPYIGIVEKIFENSNKINKHSIKILNLTGSNSINCFRHAFINETINLYGKDKR